MKAALQQLSTNHTYLKAANWAKLIVITGGAQATVQATGIISGILIIRLLPLQEYAYYTIANTMLGTMTILSDGGINSGVMVQGGKVWEDRKKLGKVLVTGLDLRRKFAVVSLAICVPILLYLLKHQGAGWLASILISVALIPAFFAALSDSMLETVPKLHQDIKPLQLNQLIVSIGRLFLSGLMLVVCPFTFIALLSNGLPRIYGNIKLKLLANKFVDLDQAPDVEERKEILSVTKRIFPVALYYSFSGQITIWLLSVLGNSASIAQMGALSRLTMIVSFFSIFFSDLIIPRFARIASERKEYIIKFFIASQLALLSAGFCMVVCAWLFDYQLLWVLGKAYTDLSRELILSILSACVALLTSVSGNLLTSRGWIISPVLVISLNISSLLIALQLFDLTSLIGMLYYNILMNSIFYVFLVFYCVNKFRTLHASTN